MKDEGQKGSAGGTFGSTIGDLFKGRGQKKK